MNEDQLFKDKVDIVNERIKLLNVQEQLLKDRISGLKRTNKDILDEKWNESKLPKNDFNKDNDKDVCKKRI